MADVGVLFYIDVVCPVCGVTWSKPIFGNQKYDPRESEALMRLLSKPTCCSPDCRGQKWEQVYYGRLMKEE